MLYRHVFEIVELKDQIPPSRVVVKLYSNILKIDLVLTILSAILALSAGLILLAKYFKFRDDKLVKISAAFILMGLGLIIEPTPITLILWFGYPLNPYVVISSWIISAILQIVGFTLIVYTYYSVLARVGTIAVIYGLIRLMHLPILTYTILLILASYASSSVLSNYVVKRRFGSLVVFIGFLCLTIAYALFIYSFVNILFSIVGEAFRAVVYLMLLSIFIAPPEEGHEEK